MGARLRRDGPLAAAVPDYYHGNTIVEQLNVIAQRACAGHCRVDLQQTLSPPLAGVTAAAGVPYLDLYHHITAYCGANYSSWCVPPKPFSMHAPPPHTLRAPAAPPAAATAVTSATTRATSGRTGRPGRTAVTTTPPPATVRATPGLHRCRRHPLPPPPRIAEYISEFLSGAFLAVLGQ